MLKSFLSALFIAVATCSWSVESAAPAPLQISGIYPHLAVFNDPKAGECGIGGVVPWAGKLWVITYPPHVEKRSPDKLWAIDEAMAMVAQPESVGGTHACRLIHRESKQLIIGPYFISETGVVRVADTSKLVGRLTAIARHLADPANKVYIVSMEGSIFEVDVHTLAVERLFEKPVPGWHGKGGYTSQGRLVISNNGESPVKGYTIQRLAKEPAPSAEDAGVLAEWDGKDWRIVERRQFTEVTGPGGIDGAPADDSPLWSVGWDKRSVILKLLDHQQWSSFRLPKASHAFDPRHGWFTEWPRIRAVAPHRLLLAMHGMLYEFPETFSAANTAGLAPLCSHLRYITDFCGWNGRLVISSDDASIQQNPMAGRSQSNMWFGDPAAPRSWGPRAGWGGPWQRDAVKAMEPSVPFLVNGFPRAVLHLATFSDRPLAFTVELDVRGDGAWTVDQTITVPANGYVHREFPTGIAAQWLRLRADQDCTATAYLHFSAAYPEAEPAMFTGLADLGVGAVCGGLIRPAAHDTNLSWLPRLSSADGKIRDAGYREVDEHLASVAADKDRTAEVEAVCAIKPDFTVDSASVIMTRGAERYRLPKGDPRFDQTLPLGHPRAIREVCSERYLMNVHGTFYELPRDQGLPLIKPVCSHRKQIMDFCSWRGLLVLSGTRADAVADGHVTAFGDGLGLWFGGVDELWKLGKPVGVGGPWRDSAVAAGTPSDPYLMTGFDRKEVKLSHTAAGPVVITVEVDVDHTGWLRYQTITVPAGQTVSHRFPEGYSAHWVRLIPDQACTATAVFVYE